MNVIRYLTCTEFDSWVGDIFDDMDHYLLDMFYVFEWRIPAPLIMHSQVTDRRPVNSPVPGRNY